MPSPFPGMDPYLERGWGDVHARLNVGLCDRLNDFLPRDLRASVEARVYLGPPPRDAAQSLPDVAVLEGPARAGRRPNGGGVALARPLVLHLQVEEFTGRFIEIRELGSGGRLITAVEVLSPSNKRPGKGQKLYLKKQRELRRAEVSSVEIDLLRAGRRVLAYPTEDLRPPTGLITWRASARDGRRRQSKFTRSLCANLYRPSPSRCVKGATDAPLDLQSAVDHLYQSGRYDGWLDYSKPPLPPLDPADEAWADNLLRTAGRR